LRILLKEDKTYFPPGTQYRYSNSGYSLLALIVEGSLWPEVRTLSEGQYLRTAQDDQHAGL